MSNADRTDPPQVEQRPLQLVRFGFAFRTPAPLLTGNFESPKSFGSQPLELISKNRSQEPGAQHIVFDEK